MTINVLNSNFWKEFNNAINLSPTRTQDKLVILGELYRNCQRLEKDEIVKSKRLEFLSRTMELIGGSNYHSQEDLDIAAADMKIFSMLSELKPAYAIGVENKMDFGIIVFGHTRTEELENTLTSLERQNALAFTEVWFDGDQGNQTLKNRIESAVGIASNFPVKQIHYQRGNFGFRKMILTALLDMSRRYNNILILEDDCFPTRDAVSVFRQELDIIRDDPGIFSVYGAHFSMPSEQPLCSRFQGWGWATTSEKLTPILRMLVACYSLSEAAYLAFVSSALNDEVIERLEVTPGRQPSSTLKFFFAWDETLALLTAMRNQFHKPTPKQVVYNCGLGDNSTHFPDKPRFRNAPFNMISPSEAWSVF